jgi:hypothetical protein
MHSARGMLVMCTFNPAHLTLGSGSGRGCSLCNIDTKINLGSGAVESQYPMPSAKKMPRTFSSNRFYFWILISVPDLTFA